MTSSCLCRLSLVPVSSQQYKHCNNSSTSNMICQKPFLCNSIFGLCRPWWRQQMETFAALLDRCIPLTKATDACFLWSAPEQTIEKTIETLVIWDAMWGKPPVTGGFPSQRPVTRSFDAFFDLTNDCANNRDAGDLRRHRAHYDVTVMHLNFAAIVCTDNMHF